MIRELKFFPRHIILLRVEPWWLVGRSLAPHAGGESSIPAGTSERNFSDLIRKKNYSKCYQLYVQLRCIYTAFSELRMWRKYTWTIGNHVWHTYRHTIHRIHKKAETSRYSTGRRTPISKCVVLSCEQSLIAELLASGSQVVAHGLRGEAIISSECSGLSRFRACNK